MFCGAARHDLAAVGKATGEQKPPRLPAGVGSTHTLCRLRKAVRNGVQRSGGPPVGSWHSRRRLTSWPGGRWFPGRPVAEHLAWRGPPGARRQALESGCASIRTEGLPAAERRWRWSHRKRHSGELCWRAECEPHRPNEHLHSEPPVAPRSRIGGRPNTHEIGVTTRATGEPQERRCEALARRGRRERASECAKHGAFEFQGALELARGIRSRASGRASDADAGSGSRQPPAVELNVTLESKRASECASAGARSWFQDG